jgi:16S rRNA (adenine1518-N6/adenine1519-N6)-dimethyltransferase
MARASRVVARRRALGQNFLIDGDVARRTVAAARLVSGEWVLEVGPGRGVLTRVLLDAGVRVCAVEIDPELAGALERQRLPGLQVIEADFLRLDLAELPAPRFVVVANLPYASGTAIVERLLEHRERFPRLVVMLQREVAERLSASPGSRAYGALTVLTALWAEASLEFTVPAHAFRPVPRVESAVVRLEVATAPRVPVASPTAFRRVVRAAFAQRRKMLRNTLAAVFGEDTERVLSSVGIDPRRRAETLSTAEFAVLADEVRAVA